MSETVVARDVDNEDYYCYDYDYYFDNSFDDDCYSLDYYSFFFTRSKRWRVSECVEEEIQFHIKRLLRFTVQRLNIHPSINGQHETVDQPIDLMCGAPFEVPLSQRQLISLMFLINFLTKHEKKNKGGKGRE